MTCGMCGSAPVPTERWCERHVLWQNSEGIRLGYLSNWVVLELELWPR